MAFKEGTCNKKKSFAGEPRLKKRPQKIIAMEVTYLPRIDKPIVPTPEIVASIEIQIKTAMLITEYSNKIYEPTSYDKATSDRIYGRHWQKTIKEELQNLKSHQIWEYDELLPGRKAIGSKWIFKVKYHPNGSVARFKAKLVA